MKLHTLKLIKANAANYCNVKTQVNNSVFKRRLKESVVCAARHSSDRTEFHSRKAFSLKVRWPRAVRGRDRGTDRKPAPSVRSSRGGT